LDGGVLKLISPDINRKISVTPATVWKSLFADKNHAPGQAAQKPGSGDIW
jgi:hypothetical protein